MVVKNLVLVPCPPFMALITRARPESFQTKPDQICLCLHGTVWTQSMCLHDTVLELFRMQNPNSKPDPKKHRSSFGSLWIRFRWVPQRSRVNRRQIQSNLRPDPFGTKTSLIFHVLSTMCFPRKQILHLRIIPK